MIRISYEGKALTTASSIEQAEWLIDDFAAQQVFEDPTSDDMSTEEWAAALEEVAAKYTIHTGEFPA
jgi:hypothetical protein